MIDAQGLDRFQEEEKEKKKEEEEVERSRACICVVGTRSWLGCSSRSLHDCFFFGQTVLLFEI